MRQCAEQIQGSLPQIKERTNPRFFTPNKRENKSKVIGVREKTIETCTQELGTPDKKSSSQITIQHRLIYR
jgi:hypothetical protein